MPPWKQIVFTEVRVVPTSAGFTGWGAEQGLQKLGILEQENNLRRARKQKRELEL
jgi:hypothetical protein